MAPLLRRLAAWPGRALETLERRPGLVAGGLTAFYLALAVVLAARRLLWNDELYTFHIARLPGLAAIWDALTTGAEQLPPLVYVAWRDRAALSVKEALIGFAPAIAWLAFATVYYGFPFPNTAYANAC